MSRKGTLLKITQDMLRHEDQIIKIFEYLKLCIPSKIIDRSIVFHLNKLLEEDNDPIKKSLSLRMIMVLFQENLND